MSDPSLRSLLADAERAGPHHCSGELLASLRLAAESLDFPFAHLDLARAHDKDDLLAALAVALKLPDWFGHNWDALVDCLCDLSWKPAPGYVLFIEGHDALRAAHAGDFDTLVDVFAEVADYWRGEDVPFWTLLTPPADGKPFLPLIEI